MTYDCGAVARKIADGDSAVVSHLAELVRGNFLPCGKAPASAFLPKGRRAVRHPQSYPHSRRVIACVQS